MYIAAFVKLLGIRVVAARMERIDRELRMMPVDEGIVEADVQAFGAKCIGIFLDKVAPERRVRDFVIGVFAVK